MNLTLIRAEIFLTACNHQLKAYRIDRYLKTGISKSICHVIKHVNFQFYRAHPDRIIWEKMTIDDKYITQRDIIHQRMSLSGAEKKKLFGRSGS